MEITIIRSRRKTLALQIAADGRVIARAPMRMPEAEIRRFCEEKRQWIESKRQQVLGERRQADEQGIFTAEELQRLTARTRSLVTQRAAYYAPLLGVTYARISVRRQHSRWGSCGTNGNLSFHCLLALMPSEVADYIVVHELCHRKQMNHSPAFWREVARILPNYGAARQWLKTEGRVLMRRLP